MQTIGKLIMTLLILMVSNGLYETHLFQADVERYADQYMQIMKVRNCDVLYISASSNFGSDKGDEKDPRKISQFMSDYLPDDIRVEAINKPASHGGIFYEYLSFLPENSDVNTFVITMNLRSFGPDWVHSELETSLRQSAVFYNDRPPLLNRLIISLRAYDDVSQEERLAMRAKQWEEDRLPFAPPQHTVASWCAVEKWGDWRNPKRQLADQFIKQYGFVLDEENPRVRDFDRICALAKARGWKVIFNLLPENVELAEELAGQDLRDLMRQNADWLVKRYDRDGFVVVDNLESLRSERYRDKDFPTEHYDEVGRKIVAIQLAAELTNFIND